MSKSKPKYKRDLSLKAKKAKEEWLENIVSATCTVNDPNILAMLNALWCQCESAWDNGYYYALKNETTTPCETKEQG